MRYKNWMAALALGCGASWVLCSAAWAETSGRIIDYTNTTFGWQVLNDKPPAPTLEIVSGPEKAKALQLSFEFSDGIWIALVKNSNMALSESEGIRFQYKGSGACVNLKLKISDAEGAVFGYTVPLGTVQAQWKEVVAPRSLFTYLWGGRGPASMNWNSLNKLEITLDTDKGAENYQVDASKPGTIAFSQFDVVSTKGLKIAAPEKQAGAAADVSVPGEKIKARKLKSGYFLIHDMQSPKGLSTMSDQDGSCAIASKLVIVNKKTEKTVKVDFSFGKDGVWNAVILPTNLDLSEMKMIKFRFKGTGGAHNLIFKLTDMNQAVFGYTLKNPTNTSSWTSVVIPKNALTYAYGGPGDGRLDWKNIQKIEFTLDKKDQDQTQGTIYLGTVKYK